MRMDPEKLEASGHAPGTPRERRHQISTSPVCALSYPAIE